MAAVNNDQFQDDEELQDGAPVGQKPNEQGPKSEGESPDKDRAARLDAFGMSLARTRSEAIAARQVSGIEEIWREDEEFYEGIDDLNRGDEHTLHRTKPSPGTNTLTPIDRANRSRVFPNITGPFVDSAAAHIADILLPTEDAPWSIDATPVPEIDDLAGQYSQENPEDAKKVRNTSIFGKIKNFLSPPVPEQPQAQPQMTPEQAFQQKELARAIAKATTEQIWDWQIECQWNAEARAVIEDAARIGVGILKGPVAKNQIKIKWNPARTEMRDGVQIEIPGGIERIVDIAPGSKRVDPWNFYPHGACGQDIQNGAYTWERDYITNRQLRGMMGSDGYLKEQILLCLSEGPQRATAQIAEPTEIMSDANLKDRFERWTFYGTAEREDLEAAGVSCQGIEDAHIDVMVILVNNRVIMATLPPIDFGGYPYDVFCWRKRKNYWAGIGVARQIRTAQKIIVGGTRTMMDNAGLAGGPMIVFKQGVVRPADGVAGIGPRKLFYIAKDDTSIADATKAIGSIKVDIMVNEMLTIVKFGLELAESTSGFPMMMQGQMGSAPDRVGIVNVMDRNTNAIKRRLARQFSDDLTGRHLRRYNIWYLMHGPDDKKGDNQINVKGYASLVEREIQNQQLPALINISGDPRFGLDPKKVVKELLRSWHLVPADLEIDDDQWGALLEKWAEIMQSAGQDPRIQVAQINAQARITDREMQGQQSGAEVIAQITHDGEQKEMDRQMAILGRGFDKELQVLAQMNVSQNTIAEIKAGLAKEVMKITSTMRLAKMKAPASAMPKPAVEPPGKAKPGYSQQQ